MNDRSHGLATRSLSTKSDHRLTHVWVGDECKWCAVRRDWPGAAARCRGGTVRNQDAAKERLAKRIAKMKTAEKTA